MSVWGVGGGRHVGEMSFIGVGFYAYVDPIICSHYIFENSAILQVSVFSIKFF